MKISDILRVKDNKFTIITFLLLFIIAFTLRLSIKEFSLASIIFSITNVLILYLFTDTIARTFLRIPLIVFLSSLITVDTTLMLVYNNPLNYGVIASIFETNISETLSMGKFIFPIGITVLILISYLIIKTTAEFKRRKQLKLYLTIPTFLILLFIVPPILDYQGSINSSNLKSYTKTFWKDPLLLYSNIIYVKYPLVINDIFVTISYFDEMKKYKNEILSDKVLPEGISLDKNNTNKPDKIIFVIGESSYSAHYSLYGYSIKTTPSLDSLYNNTNLLSFYKNIISSASYTRDALRIALSFATPHEEQPFINQKNILNLAKDAGYETSWISNHGKYGLHNTFLGMVASHADYKYYEDTNNDLDLIPLLQQQLKDSNKQQFITVHLRGSHKSYSDKFDKQDTQMLGSEGKTIDYDKSIHHTDRVLKKIVELTNDSCFKSVIYYFSDHGEVINTGHAILNKWKCQYQVPLVLIQNKPFLDTDNIIRKYYDSRNRINTNATPYILGEIMGYSITDSLVEKTKRDGLYIYQADGSVILFDNIVD
ncbi:hypothetical protein D0T53_00825 [Dysgonomonas sp. 216]|uniref:sulfatase-like hydrolase/transferase n=1 Tax=Dysgonomonas sp. 216 TaxID=2302934 RepID=UPI0013D41CEB|nr:sulfatase-like hydrolase/transferase [Dysgonomonas sp. 216]NDW17455.1 hypothetical protein [Dysgonomonas sp. 216]